MDLVENIRKELDGRTGMEKDAQEKLFEKIAEIESGESNIEPLKKNDYWGVGICIILLGILPVIYYGMKLL